jgi:hypothetical protein
LVTIPRQDIGASDMGVQNAARHRVLAHADLVKQSDDAPRIRNVAQWIMTALAPDAGGGPHGKRHQRLLPELEAGHPLRRSL